MSEAGRKTNGGQRRQASGRRARASTNGAGPTNGAPARGNLAELGDIVTRTLGAIAEQASMRVPRADLDERDSDYIRESLPGMWLLASIYFRGEVRGLERIPREGPVLLVGNHSGGNLTPDTTVFTLAFNAYFGVERRFYQLAHNLVLSMPGLGFLRKYGTVAANPENANKALDSGAALLVYPGGDYEVHRPELGLAPRSTSTAARASSGWRSTRACRSCPSCPSAARRPRCSSRAASGWPSCCGSTRCSASRCCRSRSRSRGA